MSWLRRTPSLLSCQSVLIIYKIIPILRVPFFKDCILVEDISIDEIEPDKIRNMLSAKIKTFNYPFLGTYDLKRFAFYKESDGQIIAALSGFFIPQHRTMRIEYVWVCEIFRYQGIGTALFKRLEDFAIEKECYCIQLSTMDFQGHSFYQKLGYEVVGTLSKWFCNCDEIFFSKKLK